ncbi:MAG TPA: S41 family peptidase [Cyclobacteriaceae bacterium]|nr:S41 family peptidase [Cyclobacteriaceae bacterium]
MKRKISLSIALIAILFFAFKGPGEKYFDIAKSLDIFATLFKEVNAYYVDEIEPKKLVQTGIQGMLESLDPYTDYIPEEDLEAFSIQTTGQYAGVGALIGVVNKKTVITHPYENFPAHRAGLHVGDEFVSVDGKNVKGKPSAEISALLKGNPNSELKVVVERMGKPISVTLSREKIKISNVVYQGIIDNGIGYIKLDDFTPGAAKEVEEAMNNLKQKGATKIILDLRDNPGGLLHEAVNIVNLFIPKGKEVVSTKGKVQDWNKSYTTLNNPVDTQIPLAILTSGGSASASEIVAGALQDYDRAVLVGQKTFGKGLVQTTRPLAYNAQLKVTTAKYYTPSGRCIQALDYTHRKNDGTVEKFADSVKSSFKTSGGRIVYDGGGLDPDVVVPTEPIGSAIVELVRSGLVFDFATRYCNEHPVPADMHKFKLTPADLQQFESWVNEQHFTYSTDLEREAAELVAAAKNERFYSELQSSLTALQNKIQQNHSGYMTRFQPEIQNILESEIAFHYMLNKGRTEVGLASDKEIAEAKRILSDSHSYQKFLLPH